MSIAPEILSLDFAALRTLKLVYQHRSFGAAAAELGMNPSSISYTIERVRKATQDPLFLKQGGRVMPTDHCEKLIGHIDRVLVETEHFREAQDFDPATAASDVAINVTSFETLLILPQIVRRFRREAPGIRLALNYNYGSAKDILLNGLAEIYLGPQMISDSGIYGIEYLSRDQHVCMMDPSHPLASKDILALEDIRDADFAHFEPRPGWQQAPFRHAASKGVKLKRAIVSSDAISFGDIIVGTDLLAALPSRMAERFGDRLALRRFGFETGMAEHMYWTATSDRSTVGRWVRSIIAEEARR